MTICDASATIKIPNFNGGFIPMKKALALILTFAMLLGTFAIGASAARVYTSEEKVVRADKVVWSGSNGVYGSTDAFFSGDHTLTITVKGDVAAEGKDFEIVAFIAGSPVIDAVNDKISFNGAPAELAYNFQEDVWYTVEYVVVGDTTTVKVNGETVGTIDAYMQPMVYGTFYRCFIGEVVFTDADGNVRWGDDFEDGEDSIFGLEVEDYKETETVYVNENVAVQHSNVVWSGSNGVYGSTDPFFSGDHTLTVTLKGDVAAEGKDFEIVAFIAGSPVIDAVNDKISFNGAPAELAYNFQEDVWYTVEYVVVGDTTTVKVNGETVGTIDAYMQPMVYGTFYRCFIDEIIFTDADGNVRWGDDFEDGEDSVFGLTTEKVATGSASYDLGMYAWEYNYMDEAGHYFYPDVKAGSNNVSFDFMFDSLTATDGNWNGTANWGNLFELDLQAQVVGVNGVKLPYAWAADTWYHVEFINDGSNTAIYVDNAYVGTVAATFSDRLIGGLHGMVIDNLAIGDYFEDFEDKDFANKSDGVGACYTYKFDPIVEVDPITLLPNPVAEGDAQLIETTGDFASFLISHNGYDITNNKVVYNFDLALVPNDGTQTDTMNNAWFEIWSDIASRRYKIGLSAAGVQDDQKVIEWGEGTKDNFHDVVIAVNGRTVSIYLDRVCVYEGAAGDHTAIGNMTIFSAMNCSAIIDNLVIYNGDLEELNAVPTNFDWTSNGGEWSARTVQVGEACENIKHIYGSTVKTTVETCYSLGENTIYCGNCGAALYTESVPMISHKFDKYDIDRRDENGLIYSNCSNGGCVERMYVTPAEEGSYTGTMHAYFDMSDALFGEVNRDISAYWIGDNMKYENGVAVMDETTWIQNYTEFYVQDYIDNSVKNNDFSFTFDMTYNGMWAADDTVAAGGGYNNLFELCLGGESQFIGRVGYDALEQKFYSMPWSGTAFATVEAPFEMIEGETYNVSISLEWNYLTEEELDEGEIEPFLALLVKVNGEVVLEYSTDTDPDEAYFSYTAPEVKDMTFFMVRDFGLAFDMDNLVIGTADFAWTTRVYDGDLDADNALTANDALLMRKFLAKVIDDSALAVTRMDANGDGAINAKDQLTIRKALVA